MPSYYDREGNPLELMEWAAIFERRSNENEDEWVIGRTEVEGAEVSTVWMGIDHNFSDDGPPLIFETMVFGDSEYAEYQWRYSTEEEAREGHERVVLALASGNEP